MTYDIALISSMIIAVIYIDSHFRSKRDLALIECINKFISIIDRGSSALVEKYGKTFDTICRVCGSKNIKYLSNVNEHVYGCFDCKSIINTKNGDRIFPANNVIQITVECPGCCSTNVMKNYQMRWVCNTCDRQFDVYTKTQIIDSDYDNGSDSASDTSSNTSHTSRSSSHTSRSSSNTSNEDNSNSNHEDDPGTKSYGPSDDISDISSDSD